MKNRISFSFIAFVIIPIVVASVYYIFYASSQYVVETKFVIQSSKPAQVDMLGAIAGLAGTSSSAQDSYIAQEYIWSIDLLNKLDNKLKIKNHYSSNEYDMWARMNKGAALNDFLEYWKGSIDIEFDSTSGISTLNVTAFSDVMAYNIAITLLKEVEQHVNRLTERSRSDMLSFAKKELDLAEKRLVDARTAITTFRSIKKDINPEKTTIAKLEIVAELEGQLANAETELSNILKYMNPSSMKVRSLKNKVSSYQKQVFKEKKKLTNKEENSSSLNSRVADYERLLAKKAVAERLYESSLVSLEAARLNAIQKQQYLEIIASPYKPSEPEKPYVVSNIISVALGSFLFWVISSLIISAVKDHA